MALPCPCSIEGIARVLSQREGSRREWEGVVVVVFKYLSVRQVGKGRQRDAKVTAAYFCIRMHLPERGGRRVGAVAAHPSALLPPLPSPPNHPNHPLTTQPHPRTMGAYKYLEELYKKKQSDVMRFLLRVRCWEYRQLNVVHRASRPSRWVEAVRGLWAVCRAEGPGQRTSRTSGPGG